MVHFISLLLLLAVASARRPPYVLPAPIAVQVQPPTASVVGRIPGQIGDSAQNLVSSVGSEVGGAVGTIAGGVGNATGAIGKAVGNVPGALGKGVGNVGDVTAEETRKIAEAVGDTARGAPGLFSGILSGLFRGSNNNRRNKREVTTSLNGLDLAQHVGSVDQMKSLVQASLLRESAGQATDTAQRELCKLVAVLQSAVERGEWDEVAPSLIPSIRTLIAAVQRNICSDVDVTEDVQKLVNGVLGV